MRSWSIGFLSALNAGAYALCYAMLRRPGVSRRRRSLFALLAAVNAGTVAWRTAALVGAVWAGALAVALMHASAVAGCWWAVRNYARRAVADLETVGRAVLLVVNETGGWERVPWDPAPDGFATFPLRPGWPALIWDERPLTRRERLASRVRRGRTDPRVLVEYDPVRDLLRVRRSFGAPLAGPPS